jgi:hypothetical protein
MVSSETVDLWGPGYKTVRTNIKAGYIAQCLTEQCLTEARALPKLLLHASTSRPFVAFARKSWSESMQLFTSPDSVKSAIGALSSSEAIHMRVRH